MKEISSTTDPLENELLEFKMSDLSEEAQRESLIEWAWVINSVQMDFTLIFIE